MQTQEQKFYRWRLYDESGFYLGTYAARTEQRAINNYKLYAPPFMQDNKVKAVKIIE